MIGIPALGKQEDYPKFKAKVSSRSAKASQKDPVPKHKKPKQTNKIQNKQINKLPQKTKTKFKMLRTVKALEGCWGGHP